MAETLKPLSEFERKLLAKFGETPDLHQQKVMAVKLHGAKALKTFDTKPDTRTENQKTLAKMNGQKPIQEVVAGLLKTEEKSKEFNLEEWRPVHYTLFIRHQHCRNCSSKAICLDIAQLFLCHRKRGGTTEKLYLPVKSIAHFNLPRLEETVIVTIPYCHSCFFGEIQDGPQQTETETQALDLHSGGGVSGNDSPLSGTPGRGWEPPTRRFERLGVVHDSNL